MLLRIAWFELRCRLRMLSTYVYFAVFFAHGFLWMTIAGGGFSHASVDFGAGGKVPINAPLPMLFLTMIGGYFGTIIAAAVAGRATFQDVESRTTPFFFSAPITKNDYLGGRLLGAMATIWLMYPGMTLGALAAEYAPFIERSRVGPQSVMAYVAPYLTILLPNLVFTVALFFTLATLLRRMVPVYVGAVVLVLGYLIAGSITSNIETRPLAAMLDPFGGNAVDRITQYWTIAEKSSRLVPLSGLFLWNRVAWTTLGVGLLALTRVRFSFTTRNEPRRAPAAVGDLDPAAPATLPRSPALDFSRRASFDALRALTALQLRETVKNVFFLVIVLAGVLFVVATGINADQIFGTRTWPVTWQILDVLRGTFGIFILVIITFYSGELVWRERDAGLSPIFDALPLPRWVYFTSKLFALMAIQVILAAALMASAVLLQAMKGYFRFELDISFETLFGVNLVSYWILCATAMFVHVVVNNKYVGHFVMILYFIANLTLPLMGLEHRLYRFGTLPPWTYSAMNGFGHYTLSIVAFQLYWGAAAVAFAVIANALWVRGLDVPLRKRMSAAWADRSWPSLVTLAACLLVFAGDGAFIFWNTNIRNQYKTTWDGEAEQAALETKYRAEWHSLPQPTIEKVAVECDLFPEERVADLHGIYVVANESGEPIPRVLVAIPSRARVRVFSFGRGERISQTDPVLGLRVYELATPLAPHETATVTFDIRLDAPGFANGRGDTRLVGNGTFIDSSVMPHFGYNADAELADDAVRHKFGLAPRRLPPAGDPIGSMHDYVTSDSNWIDFDATVSTSPDQLAIAPGYLDKEWSEGGRRFFHYTMEGKILGFYSFLSARYTVLRDHWSPPAGAMPGSKDVAIEIDYQKGHEFDLDRMMKGVKQSLDYYTTKFGPYQHHQVRIVEFPRYETFAQSFPNTIPYSESIGFIARVNDADPDDIDYPFYVTAHEVAHQWWAHQVVSGDVQGATLLSETLSQYSALMVMKHEYGPEKMKKFLRYELDRYLRERSTTKRSEMPLVKVESQQYVHYAKGSLVMYALADYIGEDNLDAALAGFVAREKLRGPPYPDAPQLVAALREATPPQYPHLIEDMFETITLYENRATSATYEKRADGRYDVTVTVQARKVRAGETGAESEVSIDDDVDIGVLGEKGKVLALERKRIRSPEATFTLTVDQEPVKAGIDPLNKLIDRLPDDNVIAVEKKD